MNTCARFYFGFTVILSIVVEVVVLVTVMLSMVVTLPDFFSPPQDAMITVDTNAANK